MSALRRTARLSGLLAALAAAACLTSCVRLPTAGPVVVAKEGVQVPTVEEPFNNPRKPQPGASPGDIVTGFLEAMEATPLQTNVARLYLSTDGQAAWNPQRGVVAFNTHTPPLGTRNVVIRLNGAKRVGAGGQWQGAVPSSASTVTFPMVREDHQWRIARAPNALLVPRTFYERAFQDTALYYFDPSGRILVPEVVHMPQGPQLATSLVRALLLGPQAALVGVVRSFIPPGLTVTPIVTDNGVAEVNLKGTDPGPLSRQTTRLMLAQLAWTLRQDPSIQTFQVTIAGRQVSDASGSSKFRVNGADVDRYDPAGALPSLQVYALREGLLVSGQANHPTPNGGPFGTSPQGIGPFAVSLDDNQVAGVTSSSLLLGPVRGNAQPTEAFTGTGLLSPSWDFAGRVWGVQNRPGGARVFYVTRGRGHFVPVRGVTGQDVVRFLVSRDASRLVAVLRGARADRIVVSRLRYSADGRAIGGTRARPIPWLAGGSTRVRDIGWTSPTTIAVLDQVSGVQAQVRIFNVDGSTSPTETPPTSISGRVSYLLTSPSGAQTPFAVLPHDLFDLAQVDSPPSQPYSPDLHHLTYAG